MPIDFACKSFDLNEIVRCSLSISRNDARLLSRMDAPMSTHVAAELLDVDLTTAQRSLKRLSDEGLVRKRQVNLERGGYEYTYERIPMESLRELVLSRIHTWVGKVEDELAHWR